MVMVLFANKSHAQDVDEDIFAIDFEKLMGTDSVGQVVIPDEGNVIEVITKEPTAKKPDIEYLVFCLLQQIFQVYKEKVNEQNQKCIRLPNNPKKEEFVNPLREKNSHIVNITQII